jgi:hypothetical protein
MRVKVALVIAAVGLSAVTDVAFAQAPPVGPGHCVANCGGGGYRGGGGGGGGGNAAAIGSAVGLGMAIGGALLQQQQQQQMQQPRQSREQSSGQGNRKRGRDADDKKVAKGHDTKSDKTRKDDEKTDKQTEKPTKQDANANKLENTKNQQQAKQTGQPAGNPPWTGCVGNVGTVWNAGNCGHPTFPTTSAGNSAPQFHRIPYFVPIIPHEFVDALSCPLGFTPVGETFYGGTKCAPGVADSNSAPVALADVAPGFVSNQPPPSHDRCAPPKDWEPPSDKTPIEPINCTTLAKDNCKTLGQLVHLIPDEKYRDFVKKLKFVPKDEPPDSTHLGIKVGDLPINKSTATPTTAVTSNDRMSAKNGDSIAVGDHFFDDKSASYQRAQLILLVYESGKTTYLKDLSNKKVKQKDNKPPTAIAACIHSMTADPDQGGDAGYGMDALAQNFPH